MKTIKEKSPARKRNPNKANTNILQTNNNINERKSQDVQRI